VIPPVARPAPPPDPDAAPESLVVTTSDGVPLHELDWGPPPDPSELPPLVLVHGLLGTGWIWAPVARRLCGRVRVVSLDLRGHGLSGQPRAGYDLSSLAYDVLTILSANGWGADVGGPPAVIAGHGAGAMVAATAAALAPASVVGLALVDGGWESLWDATGMSRNEYAAAIAEPPEVMASMDAWLADRRGYDPATWDADQERAARAQVEEKHAGHVAPILRLSTVRAMVDAIDAYRPAEALGNVRCPVGVLVAESGNADDDAARERRLALEDVERLRTAQGFSAAAVRRFPGAGHNLMRYRADAVAAELLALLERAVRP
jgi:pimeloyl-ACP methyl ester carboxylesterase